MPLQIVTVPCLSDNYAFLIHDDASGQTAAVDVPEAAPLAEALGRHGWSLTHILLTHHHWDHVQGVDELKGDRPVAVIGAKADVHRLPPLDLEVAEGDSFQLGNEEVRVIDVSGHTVGHVAYHIPGAKAVFTADSLMALGCGRVFEGTPEMMWQSLSKLAALPGDTVVHSGHEYTETNARFALTIEPGNAALKSRGARGVPSFSNTLEQAIHSALALANARRHELATLEHLLLALIDEPDAAKVMKACNVDLEELRRRW
jgi:hydroxyacylglutathione hydrolase